MAKDKKTAAAYCGAAAVILLAAFVCLASFRPRFLEDVKSVTVNVTHTDGTVRAETFETNARDLREALEPLEMVEYADTGEGLFPVAIDGETADGSAGRYWVLFVNGVQSGNSADAQPVADGDVFDFLTVVY